MEGELELVSANVEDIHGAVVRLRNTFRTFKTVEVPFRRRQLENLRQMVIENKHNIYDALYKDLHKSVEESNLTEVSLVLNDLTTMLNSLEKLAAPQSHPRDMTNTFNSLHVQAEPYGVVLIVAPWNYPFQLVMLPFIGAIAAGNCCMIKPSESSVATSNLLTELIPKYLDSDCYTVVPGGIDISKAVLKERFDYILYTGSTTVGKIVMKQAAENLTPVTLELGGKSPVLVAPDANIEVAARRIMWGKCVNSGQSCIAPDYVLCPRDREDDLVQACKRVIVEFYGEDPQQSECYGRIINTLHFRRLTGLLEATQGKIVHGGTSDETTRYICPTLVTGMTTDDPLMNEEIFGPILPFFCVDDVDEAISFINGREKPLAFYVFTERNSTLKYINKRTSAGGVCHNDTLLHYTAESFPFGGVGHSGMGAYHGVQTFKTFSHFKPVLKTKTGLESFNSVRYPPFQKRKLKQTEWLLARRVKGRFPWKLGYLFILFALLIVLVQAHRARRARNNRHPPTANNHES